MDIREAVSGPTTKALTTPPPLELSGHRNLFLSEKFQKKFFSLVRPSPPPPLLVTGPLVEELFFVAS